MSAYSGWRWGGMVVEQGEGVRTRSGVGVGGATGLEEVHSISVESGMGEHENAGDSSQTACLMRPTSEEVETRAVAQMKKPARYTLGVAGDTSRTAEHKRKYHREQGR